MSKLGANLQEQQFREKMNKRRLNSASCGLVDAPKTCLFENTGALRQLSRSKAEFWELRKRKASVPPLIKIEATDVVLEEEADQDLKSPFENSRALEH